MQASAELPLVGNDAGSENAQDSAHTAVHATHESEQIRPRSEGISFAFRFEPPREHVQAASADDDGPIIRRIDGMPQARSTPRTRDLQTPRLFKQPSSRNTVAQSAAASVSIPAMEESLLGDQAEDRSNASRYRSGDMTFSVEAIRAQRMRNPEGTRKPATIAAKMAIATFVGITCISSGITLGLYGPELGYQVERQARLASASVAGLLTWPGSATGDQGQVNAAESRRQTAMTAPVATSVGYTKPAAVTGSKMFYDRILPSRPAASAQVDREAAARASLTGLEKHLAVPFDLQSAQIKRVSASTE